MSFISWQYPLFLAVVTLLYWRLKGNLRIFLVLLASYLFYGAWDARFLALLMTSTAIDYFCGLGIIGERARTSRVALTACAPLAWLGIYMMASGKKDSVAGWILGAAAIFPLIFTLIYEPLTD